jgi:hypothetical protein
VNAAGDRADVGGQRCEAPESVSVTVAASLAPDVLADTLKSTTAPVLTAASKAGVLRARSALCVTTASMFGSSSFSETIEDPSVRTVSCPNAAVTSSRELPAPVANSHGTSPNCSP